VLVSRQRRMFSSRSVRRACHVGEGVGSTRQCGKRGSYRGICIPRFERAFDGVLRRFTVRQPLSAGEKSSAP